MTPGAEDWSRQLQELADWTNGRAAATSAHLQRLVVAAGQGRLTPEALAAALPHYGEERGQRVYEELARAVATFLAGVQELVCRAGGDYLTRLVPVGAVRRLGPRPVALPPPATTDPAAWAGWYATFSARAGEQQVWLARLYGLMLEEVAAGRLPPEAAPAAADEFLRSSGPDYLTDLAERCAHLVASALAACDGAADDFFETVLGVTARDAGAVTEVVVHGSGPAGSTVIRSLLVENTRGEVAAVTCRADPAAPFGLSAEPERFELPPGGSRAVTVRVRLGHEATGQPVDAGIVTVRGQDERPLVVRVLAGVHAAPGGNAPG